MLVVFLAASLAAVAPDARLYVPEHIRAFTPAQRAAALDQARRAKPFLDAELFDYPTARFRDVAAVYPDETWRAPVFCGFVNAKNRMGAYIGWKPFLAMGGGVDLGEGAQYVSTCTGRRWLQDTRDYSADLLAAPSPAR